MKAIFFPLGILFVLTGCVTTQDYAQNRAQYDHPCKKELLFSGPTNPSFLEGYFTGSGRDFMISCDEPGNQWRAIYSCDKSMFDTTCIQSEFKNVESRE